MLKPIDKTELLALPSVQHLASAGPRQYGFVIAGLQLSHGSKFSQTNHSMKKVCIINTGGTIGMKRSVTGFQPEKGFLAQQLRLIPQLIHEGMPAYELIEFDPVIDSSNMRPSDWQKIANDIYDHYLEFDGFVVLHGTDTMAYTASALPLMLRGLNKSVIITGSQIPLAEVRNDARENLITALMLAADYQIPEVCILFGDQLLRGCRTTKISASSFDAFDSPNYPPLGTVGSRIHVFADRIRVTAPDAQISVAQSSLRKLPRFDCFPACRQPY